MSAHRITFENNTVNDSEAWGLFVDAATRGTIIRSNAIEYPGGERQKTGVRIGEQVATCCWIKTSSKLKGSCSMKRASRGGRALTLYSYSQPAPVNR